jgi:hypothetical protein
MKYMSRRAKVIPFPKSSPPPARRTAPVFIEVRRCRDQGEALVVRGLLESEGIAVVFRSNLAPSVYPFSVGNQGEVTLLVSELEAARARHVLARVSPPPGPFRASG